jgi:hypothetical protein
MAASDAKKREVYRYGVKGQRPGAPARLRLAAVGMEAEFSLVVDGRPARPEDVFGTPKAFLTGPALHREGSSYSLPTGGAVYFDTGVIEVATPVIELEPGCMARAGRSLWEAIGYVRLALDAWERKTGRDARLVGFSTHYNVSFERPDGGLPDQTVGRLALLLVRLLPPPVMLLAANRRSSGIGVRPRGNRIEITADFTPSAALMIAAGTVIAGVTRAVMAWPSYRLGELEARGLPRVAGFRPQKHPSRKGWRAAAESFPNDPFSASPDDPIFPLIGSDRVLSLRELARACADPFEREIRQVSGPFSVPLIRRVLDGDAPALLDLPDRPEAYDDVGRLCLWDDLFPERTLRRSRYERVLIRSIAGVPLRLGRHRYTPIGLQGWGEVVFRRDDGSRHAFPLDYLLDHLDTWERG